MLGNILRSLRDASLALLSQSWSGVLLALGVAGAGAVIVLVAPAGWLIVGAAVVALGALLFLGALRHLWLRRKAWREHPPRGQLVDVGGYRIHVIAEGDARGRPSVVWMPGGHGGGLALDHLHRRLRESGRSILVDRPGTGWSDAGSFPRTTHREVDEVATALERAGERGPFVLVGHSFGGLLFACFARKYPDRVAALLLMDATPPDTIVYGPPIPGLVPMRWGPVLLGMLQLFGLDFVVERLQRFPGDRRVRPDRAAHS